MTKSHKDLEDLLKRRKDLVQFLDHEGKWKMLKTLHQDGPFPSEKKLAEASKISRTSIFNYLKEIKGSLGDLNIIDMSESEGKANPVSETADWGEYMTLLKRELKLNEKYVKKFKPKSKDEKKSGKVKPLILSDDDRALLISWLDQLPYMENNEWFYDFITQELQPKKLPYHPDKPKFRHYFEDYIPIRFEECTQKWRDFKDKIREFYNVKKASDSDLDDKSKTKELSEIVKEAYELREQLDMCLRRHLG